MTKWIYFGCYNDAADYQDHEFEIEGDDSTRYILTLDKSTGQYHGTIITGEDREKKAEGMDAEMVEELKGQIS